MGLGPSWTVMSLLNNFAAIKAGIHPDRFRTCGDDLIALGTDEEFDRYEKYLADLTLQPNKEKSFRGYCGVFCERFVKTQIERIDFNGKRLQSESEGQTSSYRVTAVSESHVRIAQANGVRLLSRGMADGAGRVGSTPRLLALSQHRDPKICKVPQPIKDALQRTINRFSVGDCGPVTYGGGGRGTVDHRSFMMFLKHGVFNPIRKYKSPDQEEIVERFRQQEIVDEDPQGKYLPRKEALTECLTTQASYDQCLGHTKLYAPVSMKIVRQRWKSRYRSIKNLTPFKALKAWKEDQVKQIIVKQDLERLNHTYRKVSRQVRYRNYTRAINIARNYQPRAPLSLVQSITVNIPQTTRVLNPGVSLRTYRTGRGGT